MTGSANEWVIDSGASTHICCSRAQFVTLDPINTSVGLPNDERNIVNYAGTVSLSDDLILKRVCFVSQFNYNLLPISVLTAYVDVIVHFSADCYTIQEKSTLNMIGKGILKERLYVLLNK